MDHLKHRGLCDGHDQLARGEQIILSVHTFRQLLIRMSRMVWWKEPRGKSPCGQAYDTQGSIIFPYHMHNEPRFVVFNATGKLQSETAVRPVWCYWD